MKRILTAVFVIALLAGAFVMLNPTAQKVFAVGPNATFLIFNSGDPCSNPNVAKTFAVVNISSATTTELVAAPTVATQVTYLCALTVTATGTSPTLQFKSGTKVTNPCDTGATNQSGTYAPVTGTFLKIDANGGTILTGAVGGELCLTSAGTGPSIQGNIAYVTQ